MKTLQNYEQSLQTLSQGSPIPNLKRIRLVVSEKKIFEKIANEDDEDNAGHRPMPIAHGLSPGELIKLKPTIQTYAD